MAPPPSSFASALTMSAVGLWCKGFMGLATREFRVDGREHLFRALRLGEDPWSTDKPPGERKRRGVLTSEPATKTRADAAPVCNHNSVVDDPMSWALLPASAYSPLTPAYTCHNNRWTLGGECPGPWPLAPVRTATCVCVRVC